MRWILTFLLLGAVLAGGPAFADKKKTYKEIIRELTPMRFVIVSGKFDGCETDCPQWISAEGDIVQGTASEFKRVLKGLGKKRLPLLIHSGGGSVEDALAMGRLIRSRKLDVVVARTEFAKCQSDAKNCKGGKPVNGIAGLPVSIAAYCASSCAFVLASGVNRVVGPGAAVGVHQIKTFRTYVKVQRTFSVRKFVDASGNVRVEKKLVKERRVGGTTKEAKTTEKNYDPIEAHFKAMGISDALMVSLRKTPYEDMYWLPEDELAATHLATSKLNAFQAVLLPRVEIVTPGKKELAKAREALAATGKLEAALDLVMRVKAGGDFPIGMRFTFEKGASQVGIAFAPVKQQPTKDLRATIVLPGVVSASAFVGDKADQYAPLETALALEDFCQVRDNGLIVVKLYRLSDTAHPAEITVDVRGAVGAPVLLAIACAAKA